MIGPSVIPSNEMVMRLSASCINLSKGVSILLGRRSNPPSRTTATSSTNPKHCEMQRAEWLRNPCERLEQWFPITREEHAQREKNNCVADEFGHDHREAEFRIDMQIRAQLPNN